MLKTIINGQNSFRQEVLKKMDKLDQKIDGVDNKIDGVEKKLTERIDSVEKNLTERIDRIGKQLAYLEDDTPKTEEFNELEKSGQDGERYFKGLMACVKGLQDINDWQGKLPQTIAEAREYFTVQ